MPQGRPSLYTPEIAADICTLLAQGKTLRSICREEGMPDEVTVRGWARHDLNGFFAQYTKARDIGIDAMVDEMVDVAKDGSQDWVDRQRQGKSGGTIRVFDSEHAMRSRLIVDTLKWYCGKMAPKRYGEKVEHQVTGAEGGPLNITVTYVKPDASNS